MRIRLITAALTLIPTAAFAHTGVGDAHGFVTGFAHPVGGLDHILAMVTVGIFAIFHGHSHGTEVALDPAASGYVAGFMLATALLHVAGIALGCAISRIADNRAAYRFGGALVALAGLAILTQTI